LKNKAIQTLEAVLAHIEDNLFLLGIMCERMAGRNPFPAWDKLRNYFQNQNGKAVRHEVLVPLENAQETGKRIGFSAIGSSFWKANLLTYWVFGSRRVYSASPSLVDMMLETNLPAFTFREMKFVADGFCIHLEEPKVWGGSSFDTILVGVDSNKGQLLFQALPCSYRDYRPYDDHRRKQVEKHLYKQPEKFDKDIRKRDRAAEQLSSIGFAIETGDLSAHISEDFLRQIDDGQLQDYHIEIFQLALGLNLYLQTARLPEDTEHVTRAHHPNVLPKGTRKPFTGGTELFSLGTSTAFSRHCPSKGSDHEATGAVRPHFRRGFWRRPKGLGNDPTATATIWVRPTWVHQDKIAVGEKPVGSHQTV